LAARLDIHRESCFVEHRDDAVVVANGAHVGGVPGKGSGREWKRTEESEE
jgi:hypothetical protein